jgi:sugar (pentulose or hexulose) kinase
VHEGIDVVATPAGDAAAMIHCNECTAKIDPWIHLFGEAFSLMGLEYSQDALFSTLYEAALGEGKLAGFMRELLENAVSDLTAGLKLLTEDEGVSITGLTGHGGYFKSGQAGRMVMSQALRIPVTVSTAAAEGGAWGIALLAAYLSFTKEKSLQNFLSEVMENV